MMVTEKYTGEQWEIAACGDALAAPNVGDHEIGDSTRGPLAA